MLRRKEKILRRRKNNEIILKMKFEEETNLLRKEPNTNTHYLLVQRNYLFNSSGTFFLPQKCFFSFLTHWVQQTEEYTALMPPPPLTAL